MPNKTTYGKQTVGHFAHKIRAYVVLCVTVCALVGIAFVQRPIRTAHAAPFTSGNLVVYRMGDGAAALSANGTAVFLDEYTSAGVLVQSIPVPTTTVGAQRRVVCSGTATSEGYLTRSTDGQYVVFPGYDAAVGAASLATSASTTFPRVIGRVNASGTLDTSTALTDAISGGNPRGATSTNGTDLWISGTSSGGGIRYATLGATTSTALNTGPFTNLRATNIFGGQLYVSANTSTLRLGTVGTGTPTTAGQTITNLPGFPTSTITPYAFFFADLDAGVAGNDTVYVADDTGFIRKYSLVAGNWAANGTIALANVRGLTGAVSGSNVTLYVTARTTLQTVTDTSGYNATITGSLTTLATAPTNTAFQGIAFAPSAGVVLPNLTVTDVSQTETNGATTFTFQVQLSAPAGPGGVTFDIATADGTAQDDNPVAEDNDYVAQSLTSQTIAAGNSSYAFNVTVNGDVVPEANETFFVNVTNVTGATVTDGQGLGTIQNDDVSCASLSINDVSQVETNAGTTTFAFTVSLSQAGCGTVTFDIATADGTAQDDNPATEDNDYVPQSLTGQTITHPSTYTFNVTVNGDTTTEPDQTFFVNISNVSPGNVQVADGQGLGTIVNDDFTRIHDIQGPGASSPLSGSVTTRGIVTGRKNNGYFIQEPDASVDADPATSEGIFVFTSSAPPAAAAVGNLVEVTGTISEFVPSADPLQPPLTELTSPTTVQLSTGNPLPEAIPLTATFPDPAGTHDQLERLEGMRVSVASLTVGGPTGGNVTESTATSTSTGIFFGTVTGVPRAFREPGIQAPDPAPSGGTIPPIPRFDSNPEVIRVDSDGIGGTILDVSTTAVVTGLVGPLDYGFRKYTILPDITPVPSVAGGMTPIAASAPLGSEFTVGAYNLERFYDDVNDPGGDTVINTSALNNRLNKASLGIRNFLRTPDILGVIEVENLTVLQALATKINNDAVAAAQPNPMYVAYLIEGNDPGLIDVGFLVKTAIVTGSTPRVTVNTVVQENDSEQFVNPNSSTVDLHDRPFLRLDAVINASNGASYPVTVINVHNRSLNGANDEGPGSAGWATEGERVRAKRQKQAESLANLVQTRQTNNPAENIIVLGDYNAFEFNDGLGDSMNVITGTPVPDNQTAVPGDGVDLVNPDLDNLFDTAPASERYSFVFDGNAQSLDHVVVNAALIASTVARRLEHPRINADFAGEERDNAATALRLADHDPVVGYFQITAFASADVSLTKTLDTAGPYTAGGSVIYTITVANAGPDTATNIQVTDTPTNLTITNVSGSGCAALPCTIASLAAAANTSITVTATIDASGAFDNSATATATEFDPNTADNTDNTGNGGTAGAVLPTLSINDVTQNEGSGGGTTSFTFTVSLNTTVHGGVTFNICSDDGTAQDGGTVGEDTDYSPICFGSQNIPNGSSSAQYTVNVNADSTAELNETFFVNVTNVTGATVTDGQGLGTINNDDESATAGQVIISEFRFRGPGAAALPETLTLSLKGREAPELFSGPEAPELIGLLSTHDEFVEIYNNTNSNITVLTTDGSSGWALVAADGVTRFIIPNGTVIPARGHFLGVNTAGYSLSNYGGPLEAVGNNVMTTDGGPLVPGYTTDIPDGSGIALFRSATPANFTTAERLDAAGYTGVPDLYREGAGFPTGGFESAGAPEYSFLRTMTRATGGLPKDTGNNTADFLGVGTLGSMTGFGLTLGAPGPENLTSPINRTAQFGFTLLDPTINSALTPNRERIFTPEPLATFGTMIIRRTVTNNTGQPITRLRFRIVEITTHPFGGGGRADLRALNSTDQTVNAPSRGMVQVFGTTVQEPPFQVNGVFAAGGGWNTSLHVPSIASPPAMPVANVSFKTPKTGTITLGSPLNNGASADVQFKLGVMQTGNFFFFVVIEPTLGMP
ncbi:MAG: Calx-beta domain-containing protein [Pyrinomonadaceae bacterium]